MRTEILMIANELQKNPLLFAVMRAASDIKDDTKGITAAIQFLNQRKLQEV